MATTESVQPDQSPTKESDELLQQALCLDFNDSQQHPFRQKWGEFLRAVKEDIGEDYLDHNKFASVSQNQGVSNHRSRFNKHKASSPFQDFKRMMSRPPKEDKRKLGRMQLLKAHRHFAHELNNSAIPLDMKRHLVDKLNLNQKRLFEKARKEFAIQQDLRANVTQAINKLKTPEKCRT